MDKNDIPSRAVKPDSVKYIAIDKKSFSELIQNFLAVLEKQIKEKHNVRIHVDGFNGSFSNVDDFINTLTIQEWKKLTNIRVYVYGSRSSVSETLSLRFGGYGNVGLEIEYGSGMSDIVRLAIKQNINIFLSDYDRKIIIDNRAMCL